MKMKEIVRNFLAGWPFLIPCVGMLALLLLLANVPWHIRQIIGDAGVIITAVAVMGAVLWAACDAGRDRRGVRASRKLQATAKEIETRRRETK